MAPILKFLMFFISSQIVSERLLSILLQGKIAFSVLFLFLTSGCGSNSSFFLSSCEVTFFDHDFLA